MSHSLCDKFPGVITSCFSRNSRSRKQRSGMRERSWKTIGRAMFFYHLKLHCYVVIELKSGPFKPDTAGKLNFYLTAVDEEVKTSEDNPSIGLILCRDRDNVVAEYALRDLNKPIGVSRYELSATLPESLKASLPTLEEVEEGLTDERRGET